MAVDSTYFVGKRHIGQINSAEVLEVVNIYIEQSTKEFWLRYLGYAFYKSFLDAKELALDTPPLEQRFIDLLDGDIEFEYENTTYLFEGINQAIADLTYYNYVRENNESNTGSATVISKNENSRRISPQNKLRDVFNQMVDRIYNMKIFLKTNADLYPEYVESKIRKVEKINIYNI